MQVGAEGCRCLKSARCVLPGGAYICSERSCQIKIKSAGESCFIAMGGVKFKLDSQACWPYSVSYFVLKDTILELQDCKWLIYIMMLVCMQ